MTGYLRSADNENHPATSAGPGMPGTPPRYRSSPPVPSGFADIPLPRSNTTCWGYLSQGHTHLLEYPEVELSNNLAENSMRPVALGRKNWIHVGSPQAGPKVAAILSVVESCRRLKIPVRGYLAAVLPGLAGISIRRLAELTPSAWISCNR